MVGIQWKLLKVVFATKLEQLFSFLVMLSHNAVKRDDDGGDDNATDKTSVDTTGENCERTALAENTYVCNEYTQNTHTHTRVTYITNEYGGEENGGKKIGTETHIPSQQFYERTQPNGGQRTN